MSQSTTAAYIAEMTANLHKLARRNGLADLAYMLAIATVAANEHTAPRIHGQRAARPKAKSTKNVIQFDQRRERGNYDKRSSA
jgi:hypothetical protein